MWPHMAELSEPAAGSTDPALESRLAIAPEDGLMVVYYRSWTRENAPEDIAACIEDEIRSARPSQRLVSFDAFRRAAFPQLEDAALPRDPKDLAVFFEDPRFRERLAPLGIRWIVFVSGVSSI